MSTFNVAVVAVAYVIVVWAFVKRIWALVKRVVRWGLGIGRRHDRTMRSYLIHPRTRWSKEDSELLSDLGIDPHRVADDAVRRGAS